MCFVDIQKNDFVSSHGHRHRLVFDLMCSASSAISCQFATRGQADGLLERQRDELCDNLRTQYRLSPTNGRTTFKNFRSRESCKLTSEKTSQQQPTRSGGRRQTEAKPLDGQALSDGNELQMRQRQKRTNSH